MNIVANSPRLAPAIDDGDTITPSREPFAKSLHQPIFDGTDALCAHRLERYERGSQIDRADHEVDYDRAGPVTTREFANARRHALLSFGRRFARE
jgi:hypothetical protein